MTGKTDGLLAHTASRPLRSRQPKFGRPTTVPSLRKSDPAHPSQASHEALLTLGWEIATSVFSRKACEKTL